MKEGSFRHGGRKRMKSGHIGSTSRRKRAATDWNRIRHMTDAEIDRGIRADPDVHPTDEEFWKGAKVVWPSPKAVVTIRLDKDLLEWFRRERGYQTRINAILRAYMAAHNSASAGK